MAEAESGSSGVEVFEGDAATPEAIALALNAMTFAIGRRFLIVDGVERWKDAEVEATLAPALAGDAARHDGRASSRARTGAPRRRRSSWPRSRRPAATSRVEADARRPRSCRAGSSARPSGSGITLEGAAAQALVAHVGERQQRLLRELEKLALEHGAGRAHRRRGGRGGRRAVGRAPGVGPRRRARGPRPAAARRAPSWSCARRARRCRAWCPLMARRVRDVLAIADAARGGGVARRRSRPRCG